MSIFDIVVAVIAVACIVGAVIAGCAKPSDGTRNNYPWYM